MSQQLNSSTNTSTSRLNRITECTINSIDLRGREIEMIGKALLFQSDEKLEILYSRNDNFEEYFGLDNNILVGVTNKRVFKMENASNESIFLNDISSCSHQKNSWYKWDKIEMKLKDGTVDTLGIHSSDTTRYFVNFINTKLKLKEIQ